MTLQTGIYGGAIMALVAGLLILLDVRGVIRLWPHPGELTGPVWRGWIVYLAAAVGVALMAVCVGADLARRLL